MKITTVKIVHPDLDNQPLVINEEDYNPDIHSLWEEDEKPRRRNTRTARSKKYKDSKDDA